MIEFNIRDWFWIVGGDAAHPWSSAAALADGFDGGYLDTQAPSDRVTRIANEAELVEVVRAQLPEAAPPKEPGTTAPTLSASAFNVNIENGDIPAIDGVFNIAAAIYFDVGLYMMLFLTPQPDDNYFVTIAGGAPCMAVSEKNVDYIMIEARSSVGGDPIDPAQFGVQVYRT